MQLAVRIERSPSRIPVVRHMMLRPGPLLRILVAMATAPAVRTPAADYRQQASVADAAGRMATNVLVLASNWWRHVDALAQPGGIRTATNYIWHHYAGFLHAADVKQAWRDTDRDGAPDELDTDNDNDGLEDAAEVAGTPFDPPTPTLVNCADTDNDGATDLAESLAGTDPTDPDANLRLVVIMRHGDRLRLGWRARGGWTYAVAHATTLGPAADFQSVGYTNAQGGAPPWYSVTTYYEHASATTGGFYRVATER